MNIVKRVSYLKSNKMKMLLRIWQSEIIKVILICIILFLIFIDYWGISLFCGTIDYDKFGTVGDWFSNFTTIITIVFAAITIRNERINAEKDRNFTLELRDQEEKKRLQEEKNTQEHLEKSVYVWLEGKQDVVTRTMSKVCLCTSNKSGTPIFEWEIINEEGIILANSLAYGPIFDDTKKMIEVKKISIDTKVFIKYKSFSGKWYIRSENEVREVVYG